MNFLTKLIGAPIKDTLGAVGDLVGKFVTDPDKKVEARLELAKLESELQLKMIEADMAWAQTQADVIKTEANSNSWMARNWRPSLMFVFIAIIANNYLIAPIFSLSVLTVPDQMWELIKIGLGGYVIGRSAEKIAESISLKK
jgi:hypothetical protein